MTSEVQLNNLELNRLDKMTQIREQGIEPYPTRAHRTTTSGKAIAAFEKNETKLAEENAEPMVETLVGRIRAMRPMGKIVFAHIEDIDGRIQLFFRLNDVGQEGLEYLKSSFDLGDFVQATGQIFRTRTGEITLRVSEFKMLAKAITPLPAAKEEEVDGEIVQHAGLTDPETRYRQRYADLAVNAHVRDIFKVRAGVTRYLRQFFDDRDFIEVETPILQPIYGGAAARPFTTYHNQLKQELFLRISFELYLKRLVVGGIERVYEIGRDFRNEGVDRTHNPEFTQIEFYEAYSDYLKVMETTEQMVAYVAGKVLGTTKVNYQGHDIDFGKPWQRLEIRQGILDETGIEISEYKDAETLSEAMKEKGMKFDPKLTRGKLIDFMMGEFLEPKLIQPTFLYNYPRDISPLAKNVEGDPLTVERFEGFIAGFELCNAFTELNDPQEQEKRFLEMGRAYNAEDDENHPMDEDYLRAMRYGMPPCGGFGMGIDRLVMLLTDQPTIREVLLFPHLRDTGK